MSIAYALGILQYCTKSSIMCTVVAMGQEYIILLASIGDFCRSDKCYMFCENIKRFHLMAKENYLVWLVYAEFSKLINYCATKPLTWILAIIR